MATTNEPNNNTTAKRVRLTSDAINSYGTRVLTSGMDISQYEKNPVLLWMHWRGEVIGYLTNIEKTDTEVTAELVFDEATERSKQCKQQFEVGSLRMVSVGIDIIELSEDPQHVIVGQTRPTITKSKLFEVSLVDIGANDDAIVLRHNGQTLTLKADGTCDLPMLNNKTTAMEQNQTELLQKENEDLKAQNQELTAKVADLSKQMEQMQLAAVTEAVEQAIADKRISADKKEHFINLGKQMGIDSLRETLGAITLHKASIIDQLDQQGDKTPTKAQLAAEWDTLDRQNRLAELKKNDPEKFKTLFEARFK